MAILAAGLLGALALLGKLALPRVGRAGAWFLGSLAGLAVWSGASLAWSIQADRSWDYANLTLAYVAFAVVGTFAGVRVVAGALATATGLALAWGLLGKAIPSLDPLGDTTGRLTGTLDYWNAFALVAAWGVPLGLWLVASRVFAVRLAGLLLVYGATVGLLLTFSRGGLAVAAAAVALWLLLIRERLDSLAALAIGALPGVAVSLVAFALPGVSKDDQPRHVRVHDAPAFAAAVLVGAAVVVGVAWWLRRRPVTVSPERRRTIGKALLLAIPVLAVLAVAGAAVSGPLTIHGGPSRFFHLGSSDRVQWWKDAVNVFRDHPYGGSGAGTFQLARRALGSSSADAVGPHDLPLQFLAELGLVGAALLVLLFGSAAVAVVGAVRRNGLASKALAAVAFAYGLHSLLEFDWDFVALTGPALLVVGALAAEGRPVREPVHARLAALGVVLVALAAVFSVTTPWRADRRLQDSLDTQETSPARAAAAAGDAHRINPLSAEALRAWADAEVLLRNDARALELYREATQLQPENPLTWRSLGEFQTLIGQHQAAAQSLARARELDPNGG